MKTTSIVTCLLLVLSYTLACADDGPYIGVTGGMGFIHNSDRTVGGSPVTYNIGYKPGLAFNICAGGIIGSGRFEGEFGYKPAEIKKSALGVSKDTTIMSYMLNGYYDIKTNNKITPFIGAGIGVLHAEMGSGGDNKLGYQFITGAGYSLSNSAVFDISYRLQGSGADFDISGGRLSYMSSSILGGIRVNF